MGEGDIHAKFDLAEAGGQIICLGIEGLQASPANQLSNCSLNFPDMPAALLSGSYLLPDILAASKTLFSQLMSQYHIVMS